jgi:hypothetical protein
MMSLYSFGVETDEGSCETLQISLFSDVSQISETPKNANAITNFPGFKNRARKIALARRQRKKHKKTDFTTLVTRQSKI